MVEVELRKENVSADEAIKKVKKGGTDIGAIVAFLGFVRKDESVKSLKVEAYEDKTAEEFSKIRSEAMKKFSVNSVEVIHRVGSLGVGENIMLIVCGAKHRKEAFSACEYIVDEIKRRVPIWKKEIKEDGGERWLVKGYHDFQQKRAKE